MRSESCRSSAVAVVDADVDRGPGWLFVRLRSPNPKVVGNESMAQGLWTLMQQHLTRRVVIELDAIEVIEEPLLEQIIELHELVQSHGGLVRLSGVSPDNREALRESRFHGRLPQYESRAHAVMMLHGAHGRHAERSTHAAATVIDS